MAATARRANHNASPAARTNQASQPRPRRNDNIGTNIPSPNSHPQPRHARTRMPRTATVNTATPTTARGQAFSGGNDVHTATPARVHATTRTTNGEERPTNRRYSLDPSLDLGPDALRTDPPAVGCRRRAVVYWAPGPLPGGRTPPTSESAPSNRSSWTWHPPVGTGARSAGPGQPGYGVAPSYAERPRGGRR